MMAEKRPFGELELAQQNRTGICQPLHDGGVKVGHIGGVIGIGG
jgi:hypothetical protein